MKKYKNAKVIANRCLYTEGRPPWYDNGGSLKEPFLIGVSGGTASGKTTVCEYR